MDDKLVISTGIEVWSPIEPAVEHLPSGRMQIPIVWRSRFKDNKQTYVGQKAA
jgi:hypothetical protein